MRMINGTIELYPAAEFKESTSYSTGSVAAKCMNNPYDLVIGNTAGATYLEST